MTAEVNIIVCFILFVVYVVFDVLYGWYILAVQKLKAERAGVLSMLIGAVSYAGIYKFTDNPWYGVPIILGGGVGTYLLLLWERKRKSKNDIKNN